MSGKSDGYCVSKLYVWGGDFDPSTVSERLGLSPDKAWRKGDRKIVELFDGSVRTLDFVHPRSCWRRAIDEEKKLWDVAVQLEYWCNCLSGRETILHEFHALGYEIEIDCFIKWGSAELFSLAPEILEKLGALHVKLSFGVYSKEGFPDEHEAERR